MYEYAAVHVVYTIPVAFLLTVILWPLCNRLDVYKIVFLCTVAFTYTIPWDSHLIRSGIWTYPPQVILGPTWFSIPVEELFFFLIQTYITTVLQILLNKPVLLVTYLCNESTGSNHARQLRTQKCVGQAILTAATVLPLFLPLASDAAYIKLILVWSCPVLLMLWTFSYQLLLDLPWTKTWLPIWVPTLYLWLVDTIALRQGTWAIAAGTKLGFCIWPYLEVEEALFFLITNILVVWGSCAFDTAITVIDAFPDHFPSIKGPPSPILMVKSLLLPTKVYDSERLRGIQIALTVLARKSRSFYLASGVFAGRLRLDLVLLYSFCRVADDLIDDAPDAKEASKWIQNFTDFLDASYSAKVDADRLKATIAKFPPDAQSILRLLPVKKLRPRPLYSLLEGFRIDLDFLQSQCKSNPPIKTEADLERYASCVASTIGELCLSLVYHHDPARARPDESVRGRCVEAGARMGRALQYINIVRDVTNDARVGRCYIPEEWFGGLDSVWPHTDSGDKLLESRERILDMAFDLYRENRDAIEDLPEYARDGIRVAVESYMEIGRVLRERLKSGQSLDFAGGGKKGRASVPRLRRIWVGWKSMAGWRGST